MSDLFFGYDEAQYLLEASYDQITTDTDQPKDFALETVFESDDFKRSVFTTYDVAGPGLPQERQMMQDLAPVAPLTGDPHTVRPFFWGGQMAVPQELVRMLAKFGPDDNETATRIGTYASFLRDMKYNGYRRAELERVAVLLNGTSTSSRFAGRRGEPLFSTNHRVLGTGGDQSNLTLNMPLTENNLNFVINALSNQKDENGAPISSGKGWYLITGTALETKGWTILNTENKTGSAENDKNRIYSMRSKIDHVVSQEFDADFDGWFVVVKGRNGLKFKWMDRPYFQKESRATNNTIIYTMNEGARAFYTTWRGAYASLPS